MSSAALANIGLLYINVRKVVEEHNMLEEMEHKQPVQKDNSTAEDIINLRVQPPLAV